MAIQPRTETKISTIEHTKTIFACDIDGCSFTADDETEARRHDIRKHRRPPHQQIGEEFAVYLADKEIFWQWLDCEANHREPHGDTYTGDSRWVGPGWYVIEKEYRSRGCGCCSYTAFTARPLAEIEEEIREELLTLGTKYKNIKKLRSQKES